AREEARLGRAEQETKRVKRRRSPHEDHARGDEAPHDHDARNPDPGAYALENQVRGHFEQEITDEDDAGAQTVDRVAVPEVRGQLLLGETDVHPTEKGRHEADAQEWNELPRDFCNHAVLELDRVHLASMESTPTRFSQNIFRLSIAPR